MNPRATRFSWGKNLFYCFILTLCYFVGYRIIPPHKSLSYDLGKACFLLLGFIWIRPILHYIDKRRRKEDR